MSRLVTLFSSLCLFATFMTAQEGPKIQKVPTSRTSPASGEEMYTTYCSVCHGKDGKGGGPAAAALKIPPRDLTALSANNHGKFPELRVYQTIQGDYDLAAHGSRDMPVWGQVFSFVSSHSEAVVKLRITNLTKYVQSLQAK